MLLIFFSQVKFFRVFIYVVIAVGFSDNQEDFPGWKAKGWLVGGNMDDVEVISISRRAVFDLKEARRVLPVIRRVTQEISGQVEILLTRLEGVPTSQMGTVCDLENRINELISQWHEKIRKLGAHPKGLWLVDFDYGQGYFCWKYPEPDILHWHGYNDGFTGRKMIGISELHEDSISPNQPGPGGL